MLWACLETDNYNQNYLYLTVSSESFQSVPLLVNVVHDELQFIITR